MRRRHLPWMLVAAAALVVLPMAREIAGAAAVNYALLEYLRASRGSSAPPAGDPEDVLLARFDRAARIDPSVAGHPQYRLLASLRRGARPAPANMCPGERNAHLLIAVLNRARRLSAAGQNGNAEELYRWADAACADVFDVLVEWAQLEARLGDYAPATALLTRAVRLEPTIVGSDDIDKPERWWKNERRASAHVTLGDLYLRQDDTGRAVGALEQAKRVSPEPLGPWALQLLGIAYYRAGRLADAAQTFRIALAASPDLQDARAYLDEIESGRRR